jgi:hypothetical protein
MVSRVPLVLLSVAPLAGCVVSSGRKFEVEDVKRLGGKSMAADVLAVMGTPDTSRTDTATGTETWTYAYVEGPSARNDQRGKSQAATFEFEYGQLVRYIVHAWGSMELSDTPTMIAWTLQRGTVSDHAISEDDGTSGGTSFGPLAGGAIRPFVYREEDKFTGATSFVLWYHGLGGPSGPRSRPEAPVHPGTGGHPEAGARRLAQ